MATHSFRRNYIASVVLDDGTTVSDHTLKAGALWNSFKDRLGVTDFDTIQFDLDMLIQPVNLPDMYLPFQMRKLIVLLRVCLLTMLQALMDLMDSS